MIGQEVTDIYRF